MAVTILAFVYVPLNLATSIFGMNIQELNQNGQQFWVFMTTAVTVLIITTGSWFFLEQVNNYKTWTRGILDGEPKRRSGAKYTLAARVAMLVWLVLNGHKSWMQTSGAWWRILVNDRTSVQRFFPGNMTVSRSTMGMTAGDYVTEFIAAERPGFDPFDHGVVSWNAVRTKTPPSPISQIFARFFTFRSQRNTRRDGGE